MALYILQPGIQPLGQFDVLDTDQANVVGGLIGTWDEAARANSASETAAADVLDGYVADGIDAGDATGSRPVIRIADSSASDDSKAFYLLDDGIAGYGTLFGSVVSMLDPVGAAVGPHTSLASGKVTCWDKPGLYAVSFEACHSAPSTQNGALSSGTDTPLPGELLYRHQSTGKIARAATAGGTVASNKVGVYIEHGNSGSLVTTPGKLVGATEAWDRIVFQFLGSDKNI